MQRTDLELAYVAIGRQAIADGAGAKSLTIDGYNMTIGLRRIPDDLRHADPYYGLAIFQGVTRVDRLGAERIGLDVTPEFLDLWIADKEDAVDALFKPVGSREPVFDPANYAFAFDRMEGGSHVLDRGRYRVSAWIIGKTKDIYGGLYDV